MFLITVSQNRLSKNYFPFNQKAVIYFSAETVAQMAIQICILFLTQMHIIIPQYETELLIFLLLKLQLMLLMSANINIYFHIKFTKYHYHKIILDFQWIYMTLLKCLIQSKHRTFKLEKLADVTSIQIWYSQMDRILTCSHIVSGNHE